MKNTSAPLTPHYQNANAALYLGDAVTVMRQLPAGSVACCVTSPPYWGLRDYGTPGQLGLEATPDEYVANMVGVFAEVRRLLADDGTLWLNLGDSYAARGGDCPRGGEQREKWERSGPASQPNRMPLDGLKPKDLVGIPWRVAFALQADGWYLRNAIVWHKTNGMPHSVTDRLTNRYELIFLLTKSERYWFDLDAIREPLAYPEALDGTRVFGGRNKGTEGGIGATERNRGHNAYGKTAYPAGMPPQANIRATGERHTHASDKGRNPGDVWSITTKPYPKAHFATFPPDLPERCIAAGCKPGGAVLDPFSGSGTTGEVAIRLGRSYVGIDLNETYQALAIERVGQQALDLTT